MQGDRLAKEENLDRVDQLGQLVQRAMKTGPEDTQAHRVQQDQLGFLAGVVQLGRVVKSVQLVQLVQEAAKLDRRGQQEFVDQPDQPAQLSA